MADEKSGYGALMGGASYGGSYIDRLMAAHAQANEDMANTIVLATCSECKNERVCAPYGEDGDPICTTCAFRTAEQGSKTTERCLKEIRRRVDVIMNQYQGEVS